MRGENLRTFQDLEKAKITTQKLNQFLLESVTEYKNSAVYKMAIIADQYAEGNNTTISEYQKILYTIAGQEVPDNISANHKCKSNFLSNFNTQECAYLLTNGVIFQKKDTAEKLGETFQEDLFDFVGTVLDQGVGFGFYDVDRVHFFKATEFVPLQDEKTSALKAGIRFWQIEQSRPLYLTLYEIDGFTEYVKEEGKELKIAQEKRAYILKTKTSIADGTRIYDESNYTGFPIVPLWANKRRKSELYGRREQIDCYDLIKSGFANDLDDISQIFWILKNAGGMDDMDLVQFRDRLKTIKVANLPNGDEGATAEPHTIEPPYQSRESLLNRLERDLYRDFMGADVRQIAAGNVTATQIDAAYDDLDHKAAGLAAQLNKFLKGILAIAQIDDKPYYQVHRVTNKTEDTQMLLSAAEYLDDETIIKKLPMLTSEEAAEIIKRRKAEELERNKFIEPPDDGGDKEEKEEEEE